MECTNIRNDEIDHEWRNAWMNCCQWWMRRTIEVAIRDDAAEFVRTTAQQRQEHPFDTIRKALAAYKYLLRVLAEDGRVVIARKDGSRENIVF